MSFIILPTRELAQEFRGRVERWLSDREMPLPDGDLDVICLDVIRAIVNEYIDQRMLWISTKTPYIDDQLDISFPQLEPSDKFAEFYDGLTDEYKDSIKACLDKFLSKETWRVFYIQEMGGDTAVERGEDYRVMDWTRRLESGQFQLDDRT